MAAIVGLKPAKPTNAVKTISISCLSTTSHSAKAPALTSIDEFFKASFKT